MSIVDINYINEFDAIWACASLLHLKSNKLVDVFNKCYKVLKDIKDIIEDDGLEDAECFYRIEEIVKLFERLGSDGGSQHDFG